MSTVSLRSHLASLLQAVGGARSLVGKRVWSFWYADISMVQRGASHGGSSSPHTPSGEEAGGEDRQPDDDALAVGGGSVLWSPVRGNWYEAVVTSVEPKDSSIQVRDDFGYQSCDWCYHVVHGPPFGLTHSYPCPPSHLSPLSLDIPGPLPQGR